ncbi:MULTISPECIES: hypothetical protein [Flavobacterium]|uniref:Glycosyltransferase RgtA/B/C/D-like domain-containing protein n=1 Tax=Flavobacterium algoritolerans TaxID=3041254 RepID=A0ABT6VBK8_9FLAO|nr:MULTISPECIES: hypothetical protein [Flavobacterium]MDI5887453.1 hypothetical protein [Flavobacterium yafengii]MDI5895619.1 hypothetical protein [Flavobacterium algoritolerans]
MPYIYTLNNYLIIWRNFIVSYLAIILFFGLFTDLNSSPMWSYFTLGIASLLGLKIFCHLFLKKIGFNAFAVVGGAFVFKMLFSTWHFLTFVQPEYFNGNTNYEFFYDFYWMHESIQYLSDEAHSVGFLNSMTKDFFLENKGALIFYTYSPIYYFGGNLVLNLSHINAVFTLFTAVLVTFIAKNFFDLSQKQLFATLILCSFFPFGMITSMTMRDFAGQFLIALGIISLQFSFKNPKLFFLLFVSGILFYLQRKNYIIVPFATYLIFLFFYTKQSGLVKYGKKFNLRVVLLLTTIIVGFKYYQLATQSELIDVDSQLSSDYTSDLTQVQFYLLLPVYIFKGFLGPFPWSQFFKFTQETIYQISDYFTSTFIFTIIVVLWRKRKKLNGFKGEINVVTIASLIVSFAGIASGFMHLSYISISVIFLIPFVMKHMDLKYFLRNYMAVFILFVGLSILWVGFGLYGEGNWSKFRS